jgi:hypothetical protein
MEGSVLGFPKAESKVSDTAQPTEPLVPVTFMMALNKHAW